MKSLKNTISILLSLMLVLGAVAVGGMSASALSNEAKLRIGSETAIDNGAIFKREGTGWSIAENEDGITLNLDNLDLTHYSGCICAELLDLTITGSAKLTATGDVFEAIYLSYGNLTLNGDFALSAQCVTNGALSVDGNLTVEGGSLSVINTEKIAIFVNDTMTVSGGSVYAKTESGSDIDHAISVNNGIILNNGEAFALGDEIAKEVLIKVPGQPPYITGDIIEYGTYPQSEVKDENTLAALNAKVKDSKWISYGYYYSDTFDTYGGNMQPGDFMKYYDTMLDGVKYRAVTFTGYRPDFTTDSSSAGNSHQDDNGYYVSDESNTNIYWFRFDPVEWKVLDPDTGLILCSSAIDSQPYCNYVIFSYGVGGHYTPYSDTEKTCFATDFANSSIRQWLNNDFMNTAFSSSQQENILLSEDLAGAGDVIFNTGDHYNFGSTSDKIFLLSETEIKSMETLYISEGIINYEDFSLPASDYAKCQGLDCTNNSGHSELEGMIWWWTRSPHDMYATHARVVHPDGSVSGYAELDCTSIGVVPAMRLNELKSDPTGAPIRAAIPEGAELTYDNTEHTGVEIDDGYALSGTVTAIDVGKYIATATLEDGYIWKDGTTEDKEITWKITPKSIIADMITLTPDAAEYNGGEITPEITVKDGDRVLTKDTDYTVIYSNNVNVSENAKVTVTGKGNYKDIADKMFTINPALVTLTANSRNTDVYDGTEKTASGFTSSVEGLTFDGVNASGSGTNAGSYDVTFNGVALNETKDSTGNYVVTATENGMLTINPADVTVSVKGNSATEDYDGSEKSVTGYTATTSNNLYDVENDIEFSGTAEAKRTEPGNESMGLDASQFSNKNANFNATFTVEEDGKLTVNPVIKFVNEDGTELQSGAVAYGETPEYKGETPAKAASDGNTYEFAGWSPEITEATANATYTATYKSYAIGLALGEIEDSTGYREDQTFTVDTSSLPEGAEIHWFVNGEDVGTGESFTVTDPEEDYTIQAKIIDGDGKVLDETEEQTVKVKNGFIDRLSWLFSELLFKLLFDFIDKVC